MATLTVDLFVSVDGWAGSENSPGFFGYLGPDLEAWLAEDSAEPQLAILGRRTYEALAALPDEAHGDAFHKLSKVVFSSTLTTTSWPNTRVCGEDLIAEVGRLKKDGDVPLRTMGSLSLVRQLLAAGQVDLLRLMTFPLLVGQSGREPAFADVLSADLELVGHRALDGRILLIEYRPTGQDIPRA
jgi:dihydrofolate reductase